MTPEPVKVGDWTISTKEGEGVELVGPEGRIDLSDREAVALALALFRAVPEQLGREVFGNVLEELLKTMPEDLALELGLGILARHENALRTMAAHARAERLGKKVPEA